MLNNPSDRSWMHALTDEQRANLQWKCFWCDAPKTTTNHTCTDIDGCHLFYPIKPKDAA